MPQALSVGATLEKVDSGDWLHLTREEIFGLAHVRFLREHNVSLGYNAAIRDVVGVAAQWRNAEHPHVKKLKLDGPMTAYGMKLKELYHSTVDRALRHFEHTVHEQGNMVVAAEGDLFKLSSTTKETYLTGLRSILKQSKTEFGKLTNDYNGKAARAGKDAAVSKLKAKFGGPVGDNYDEEELVEDYDRSSDVYYDQMLDDIEDDARDAVELPVENRNAMIDTLTGALFGQFYRNDLFVGNLYRVAQDAQADIFHGFKDPAGKEWKYKWVAVLDTATCEKCRALNEQPPKYLNEFEYDPGDVHFYCRCDLDPVPPDEDEDIPDDATPPDTGPVGSPGTLDDNPGDDFDDLRETPRTRSDIQTKYAQLNPQRVDEYVRSTSLVDKLEDMQDGAIVAKKWGSLSDVVGEHFAKRHNVLTDGQYNSPNWWRSLSPSEAKRELDMLARVDKMVDALVVSDKSPFSRLVDGTVRLNVARVGGSPKNAAFFTPGSHTISIHDGTIAGLSGLGLDFERTRIMAHELTHAAFSAAFRGDMRHAPNIVKLRREWGTLSQKAAEAGNPNGFSTEYGRKAWMGQTGNANVTPGNVDEDIADAVGYYVLKPGYMAKDPIRQEKYKLLKDLLFDGVEFK